MSTREDPRALAGRFRVLSLACTSVVCLVVAPPAFCSVSEEEGDPSFSMPNPAAFYCRELGYGFEIVPTSGGSEGVCLLPDGRRVNAWDFYRGRVGVEYGYCSRLGLTTAARDQADGDHQGACAVCIDAEGNEVGTVWELMGLGERMTPLTPAGARGITPRGGAHAPPAGGRGTRELPSSFDWSALGGVTSVKNQGWCGSCWAFSAVAAIESDIKIKDGVAVDLSEQWLVSCNTNGWGCNGGNFAHRYHQWKRDPCGETGAVLEDDFPYVAMAVDCDCPYEHPYLLDGWGHLAGDEGIPEVDQMKEAILEHGPIDVAVFADEYFTAYTGGVFRQCIYDWAPNHTVLLVGWDDNLGAEGAWKLKNSWGPSWGEDGYMLIEYGCNYIGFGACWTEYRKPLLLSFPDGVPAWLVPGEETSLSIQVDELTDTYVPGSGALLYRYGSGEFASAPLVPIGGGLHKAVLPPADCFHKPQFYVTVEGARFGTVSSPGDAPAALYEAAVGFPVTVFSDDFETHKGWTVSDGPDLTDGTWERGVPAGGGLRGDPPTDFDGSGSCYVTDNEPGNSDVDGGTTRLITPLLQFENADDIVVQYALWYTNDHGNNPNQDVFRMYVVDFPGAWQQVRAVGPRTPTPTGWHVGSLLIGDLVNHETGFWVRFDASDTSPWSVVEAGLDAVSVLALKCDPTGVDEGGAGSMRPVLHATVPNPFPGAATIGFELPRSTGVTLGIYDAAGRLVRTLHESAEEAAGLHRVSWDGTDDSGNRVASGTYFCRLTAGGETIAGKMLLLR